MRRGFVAVSAVFLVGWSPSVLACSPPSADDPPPSLLLSHLPAEVAPEGAIQLKVSAPARELFSESPLTLQVLEVLDGDYSADTISLNVTNVDDCNSSLAQRLSREYFVTVLPLQYLDGVPVRSDLGEQEYGGLFYQGGIMFPSPPAEPPFTEEPPITEEPEPNFTQYSEHVISWFYDMERATCLHSGDLTEEAWRECVEPGEYISLQCTNSGSAFVCEEGNWPNGRPDDLRRGYSFWDAWSATFFGGLVALFAALVIGYFALRLKKAAE